MKKKKTDRTVKTVIALWIMSALAAWAAGLDFTRTLVEIHAAADAEKVTAEFEFANRSEKPVVIRKYDAACASCVGLRVKDGKLRYEPGESGLILADFKLGNQAGAVDNSVALWLDDDPEERPSVRLTVRVHIPVLVEVEPKTLRWDLGGEATPKTIAIRIHDEKPVRVKSVTSSSPNFSAELKEIEEGKHYELVVTPGDMSTPGLGIMRIETDSPLEKFRTQQAFVVISKPVATPSP